MPVLLVGCLAARAQILARLGRHDEARSAVRHEQQCAARLDDPVSAATADHDAGLVALRAGRYGEAARLLRSALDAGADVSRPTAGLMLAEALALGGDASAAAARLRAAVLEPVGRADQPWALVPRISWVQGLIAIARGDHETARRRLDEAAGGWRRVLPSVTSATADGYLANLVDLGRPPIIGLVEPRGELDRIDATLAQLSTT